jgi:hypothetical protein
MVLENSVSIKSILFFIDIIQLSAGCAFATLTLNPVLYVRTHVRTNIKHP